MASEEKRAWALGVGTLVVYGTYLAVVLGRARTTALTEVAYVGPLLATVGGGIVFAIVVQIVTSVTARDGAGGRDERDREIERFGSHVGQSFLVMGGLAGLLLALAEADHFWIANAIHLGFALSAVLESIARIVAYRRGFQPW